LPWRFDTTPKGYWQSTTNFENFMDRLATQIGIKQMDDWYNKLTTNFILENGGHRVLKIFGSSAFKLLQHRYPEYNWLLQDFEEQ
jgi:hypothetical protein